MSSSSKRILVTGTSGFAGGSVANTLAANGWEVIRLDGPSSSSDHLKADITSAESLLRVDTGDLFAVVHFAGIAHRFDGGSDAEYRAVNVQGAENVARLATLRGARHFVHISSVLVYGMEQQSKVVTEVTECRPAGAYAESKLNGEHAVRKICAKSGIGLTVLRPAPIIGTGAKGNIATLISAIGSGRFVSIGGGFHVKSFVSVKDLGLAIAAVLERAISSEATTDETFNVVTGNISMQDLVRTIAEAGEIRQKKWRLSERAVRFGVSLIGLVSPSRRTRIGDSLETWMSSSVFSGQRIRETLRINGSESLRDAIRDQARNSLQKQ